MIRVPLRLRFTAPLWPDNLFGHLAATGVPGVEEWREGAYRCAVRLAHGPAVLELAPGETHVGGGCWLTDVADEPEATALARFVLDLDTDPEPVDAALAADPALAPLVAAAPGRRVPRIADPEQFVIRAVLGQQVSTAAARTHAARLVVAHGEALGDPAGGLTHLFPTTDALGALTTEDLRMPASRRTTLLGVVEAMRTGALVLHRDADPARVRADLGRLRGIGPWTVETVLMRGLGDRDAFLASDLGVLKAATALGLPERPRDLLARAEAWRPYRAYAVQHLWATGDHPVNRMPG